MRIGVFFEKMLDRVVESGISAVEIGAGGYPGSHHCPVHVLLSSESKRTAWQGIPMKSTARP